MIIFFDEKIFFKKGTELTLNGDYIESVKIIEDLNYHDFFIAKNTILLPSNLNKDKIKENSFVSCDFILIDGGTINGIDVPKYTKIEIEIDTSEIDDNITYKYILLKEGTFNNVKYPINTIIEKMLMNMVKDLKLNLEMI